MPDSIKGFGFRGAAIFNDCGDKHVFCTVDMQAEMNISTVTTSCNDRESRSSILKGVNITVNNQDFTLSALAIMTGLTTGTIATASGATGNSLVLPPSQALPKFHIIGKIVGQEGDSDVHMRFFNVTLESLSINGQQDSILATSWSGYAEGLDEAVGEFAIHDAITEHQYIPSPEQSNLIALFDVSCCSTYADGDSVNLLEDASGYGNHLRQATGAAQPTFNAQAQNGLATISFDGVDDVLTSDAFASAFAQPFTVIAVVNVPDNSPVLSGVDATELLLDTNATEYRAGAGSNISGGVVEDAVKVHAITYNGASSTYRLNGELIASGDVGAGGLGEINVGAEHSLVTFGAITLCELRIYNSELSATAVQAITDGLISKWGVAR